MRKPPRIGQIITYGRLGRCRVLRILPLGTMDVECLPSGNCFRVSGLGWIKGEE